LYLFTGDYTNAIAIYKKHQNEMIRPDYSWVDSLKDDYKYFKNSKEDVKIFDQVFKELNIEKP
jgi:hypothetical protein